MREALGRSWKPVESRMRQRARRGSDGVLVGALVALLCCGAAMPGAHGTGGVVEQVGHVNMSDTQSCICVFPIDIDGDGDVDAVACDATNDATLWLENDGGSPPDFTEHILSTNTPNVHGVHAADVDSDGDVDVVTANYDDNNVAWFENNGAESFTKHTVAAVSLPTAVVAADMDNDTDVDIVVAGDALFVVCLNDGSESFGCQAMSTADSGQAIAVVDFDNDGDVDVVTASEGDSTVSWLENPDGAASTPFTRHDIGTNVQGTYGAYPADIDGDGDTDVAASGETDGNVRWFENDGSDTSFTENLIIGGSAPRGVYAVDIEEDGDVDVLGASYGINLVDLYVNSDGSGSFELQEMDPTMQNPRGINAADVNGDGHLDIVASAEGSGGVVAFLLFTFRNTSAPSMVPTMLPTVVPTMSPSWYPSTIPTQSPSRVPSQYPSRRPSLVPSQYPTLLPTAPTGMPTSFPSMVPTISPAPTLAPSLFPSLVPTTHPTLHPTFRPTKAPTMVPTQYPTLVPTDKPTTHPTPHPTFRPTRAPTMVPTQYPTLAPTDKPTTAPTMAPTVDSSFGFEYELQARPSAPSNSTVGLGLGTDINWDTTVVGTPAYLTAQQRSHTTTYGVATIFQPQSSANGVGSSFADAWMQLLQLRSSDVEKDTTASSDDGGFAYSTAVQNGMVLVAAPWMNSSTSSDDVSSTGAVYTAYLPCVRDGNCVESAQLDGEVSYVVSALAHEEPDVSDFGWALAVTLFHDSVGAAFAAFSSAAETAVVRVFATGAALNASTGWNYVGELKATDVGIDDRFGGAIAVVNSTIAVGAPHEEGGGVYIFTTALEDLQSTLPAERDGGALFNTWAQDDQLNSPAGTTRFGAALAMSADGAYLAVGAPGNGTNGSATVYDTVDWTQVAVFWSDTPSKQEYFGESVAFDGNDRLLVGAPGLRLRTSSFERAPSAAAAQQQAGKVHVFELSKRGARWSRSAIVEPRASSAGDGFGTSVGAVGGSFLSSAPPADGAIFALNTSCGSQSGCVCESSRPLLLSEISGASYCSSCPPGRYLDTDNGTCIECGLGLFQDTWGRPDNCTLCGVGTFTNTTGRSACTECAAGSVQADEGQSSCTPCDSGFFQDATGQVSCDACPSGTFQDETGGANCKECVDGFGPATSSSATTCEECVQGDYGEPGQLCQACPSGEWTVNTGSALGDCEPLNLAASFTFSFIAMVIVVFLLFIFLCTARVRENADAERVSRFSKVMVQVYKLRLQLVRLDTLVRNSKDREFGHQERLQAAAEERLTAREKRIITFWTGVKKVCRLIGAIVFMAVLIAGIFCALLLRQFTDAFLVLQSMNVVGGIGRLKGMIDGFVDVFHLFGLGRIIDVPKWMFLNLYELDFSVLAFSGLQVTCKGSQGVTVLFFNLFAVVLVAYCIELHAFEIASSVLRSTTLRYGALKLQQPGWWPKCQMVLISAGAMAIQGFARFFIQSVAGLVHFEIYSGSEICDSEGNNVDTALAWIANVTAFLVLLPAIQFVLTVGAPGLPPNDRMFRNVRPLTKPGARESGWIRLVLKASPFRAIFRTIRHRCENAYRYLDGQATRVALGPRLAAVQPYQDLGHMWIARFISAGIVGVQEMENYWRNRRVHEAQAKGDAAPTFQKHRPDPSILPAPTAEFNFMPNLRKSPAISDTDQAIFFIQSSDELPPPPESCKTWSKDDEQHSMGGQTAKASVPVVVRRTQPSGQHGPGAAADEESGLPAEPQAVGSVIAQCEGVDGDGYGDGDDNGCGETATACIDGFGATALHPDGTLWDMYDLHKAYVQVGPYTWAELEGMTESGVIHEYTQVRASFWPKFCSLGALCNLREMRARGEEEVVEKVRRVSTVSVERGSTTNSGNGKSQDDGNAEVDADAADDGNGAAADSETRVDGVSNCWGLCGRRSSEPDQDNADGEDMFEEDVDPEHNPAVARRLSQAKAQPPHSQMHQAPELPGMLVLFENYLLHVEMLRSLKPGLIAHFRRFSVTEAEHERSAGARSQAVRDAAMPVEPVVTSQRSAQSDWSDRSDRPLSVPRGRVVSPSAPVSHRAFSDVLQEYRAERTARQEVAPQWADIAAMQVEFDAYAAKKAKKRREKKQRQADPSLWQCCLSCWEHTLQLLQGRAEGEDEEEDAGSKLEAKHGFKIASTRISGRTEDNQYVWAEVPSSFELLHSIYEHPSISQCVHVFWSWLWAMQVKVWTLISLVLGSWDDRLVYSVKLPWKMRTFANVRTDKTQAKQELTKEEQFLMHLDRREVVATTGASHSLVFQLIPGLVLVSKFAEEATEAMDLGPMLVFWDAILETYREMPTPTTWYGYLDPDFFLLVLLHVLRALDLVLVQSRVVAWVLAAVEFGFLIAMISDPSVETVGAFALFAGFRATLRAAAVAVQLQSLHKKSKSSTNAASADDGEAATTTSPVGGGRPAASLSSSSPSTASKPASETAVEAAEEDTEGMEEEQVGAEEIKQGELVLQVDTEDELDEGAENEEEETSRRKAMERQQAAWEGIMVASIVGCGCMALAAVAVITTMEDVCEGDCTVDRDFDFLVSLLTVSVFTAVVSAVGAWHLQRDRTNRNEAVRRLLTINVFAAELAILSAIVMMLHFAQLYSHHQRYEEDRDRLGDDENAVYNYTKGTNFYALFSAVALWIMSTLWFLVISRHLAEYRAKVAADAIANSSSSGAGNRVPERSIRRAASVLPVYAAGGLDNRLDPKDFTDSFVVAQCVSLVLFFINDVGEHLEDSEQANAGLLFLAYFVFTLGVCESVYHKLDGWGPCLPFHTFVQRNSRCCEEPGTGDGAGSDEGPVLRWFMAPFRRMAKNWRQGRIMSLSRVVFFLLLGLVFNFAVVIEVWDRDGTGTQEKEEVASRNSGLQSLRLLAITVSVLFILLRSVRMPGDHYTRWFFCPRADGTEGGAGAGTGGGGTGGLEMVAVPAEMHGEVDKGQEAEEEEKAEAAEEKAEEEKEPGQQDEATGVVEEEEPVEEEIDVEPEQPVEDDSVGSGKEDGVEPEQPVEDDDVQPEQRGEENGAEPEQPVGEGAVDSGKEDGVEPEHPVEDEDVQPEQRGEENGAEPEQPVEDDDVQPEQRGEENGAEPEQPVEEDDVQPEQRGEKNGAEPEQPVEDEDVQPEQRDEEDDVEPEQPVEDEDVQPEQRGEENGAEPEQPVEDKDVQPEQRDEEDDVEPEQPVEDEDVQPEQRDEENGAEPERPVGQDAVDSGKEDGVEPEQPIEEDDVDPVEEADVELAGEGDIELETSGEDGAPGEEREDPPNPGSEAVQAVERAAHL